MTPAFTHASRHRGGGRNSAKEHDGLPLSAR
ncbi:hypothetical protein LPU83_pLPU83c_0634 (plasmid) [Rhizobium favelukesii]|uniref:Uncharacterized protein n=1 Tax=Rhizobium favelukesii TaxID=348824 RepID=W6S4G6_9HYPH|nr:hypothetical protein LPU83_pLPU83c_0634 [Rhizobium favelukesii]